MNWVISAWPLSFQLHGYCELLPTVIRTQSSEMDKNKAGSRSFATRELIHAVSKRASRVSDHNHVCMTKRSGVTDSLQLRASSFMIPTWAFLAWHTARLGRLGCFRWVKPRPAEWTGGDQPVWVTEGDSHVELKVPWSVSESDFHSAELTDKALTLGESAESAAV